MCARKYNLKVHKRNKHGEVLTTKKNTAKCEKTDDTQHQLKQELYLHQSLVQNNLIYGTL